MSERKFSVATYIASFFDVKRWFSWSFLKQETKLIKDTAGDLFKSESAHGQDDFNSAMSRYHLTEADIQKKEQAYKKVALFIFLLAAAMLGYATYLLMNKHFEGMIVALSVTSILFALAFRYHFWSYQMRRHKLGCTVKEWRQDLFKKDDPTKNR